MKITCKLGLCFSLMAATALGQDHMTSMHEAVGHVTLQTSCSAAAGTSINKGLSLFYSFWYSEASKSFAQSATEDPECAMAYWGEAISNYQPVEILPQGAQLKAGQEELVKAREAKNQTSRERSYIQALQIIFDTQSIPKAQERVEHYSAALSDLMNAYPSDHVAATLYALSLLSPELPDDPTLSRSKRALSVLNAVLAKEPDNPGVMHFIIHASDNPQMASYGLDAAYRYALIAPASAHALHMPGHIFARLGLWQDDIKSNVASEKAAANYTVETHSGAQNELHAMEFLEYAYLQIGREDEAQRIVVQASRVPKSELDAGFDGYYGWVEASFPIRLDLETGNWKSALALEPKPDDGPYTKRVIYWAQAVAAGHLRDAPAADQALSNYEKSFSQSEINDKQRHLSAQLAEVQAWKLFAHGQAKDSIALLGPVADHQDEVGKGEVELPAREMLADMLRLSNQAGMALAEYEKSLKTDPGRFNPLLHAGELAKQLGKKQEAKRFDKSLIANVSNPAPASKAVLKKAHAFTIAAR